MQTVSAEWKENQNRTIVSESYLEISLLVADPEAQSAASASDNGSEAISDTSEIVADITQAPTRYATLEDNLWILDGTFAILPAKAEEATHNGYIGNVLCGPDRIFSPTPTITITFSQVIVNVTPGITITWGEAYDHELATEFTVTCYNGEAELIAKTVTGNDQMMSVVDLEMQGYDRIVVTVQKWNVPYRRARIRSVLVGIQQRYDKSDVMSYAHESSVDLLSSSLPKNEIKYSVANLTHAYNPENPSGIGRYFMQRQMLRVRYGYKIGNTVEWINAGTFYLSEWETPRNGIEARFTARDMIEYMSDKYTGTSSGTLSQIATAALIQAQLPPSADSGNRWVLHNTLQNIAVPADVDLSQYSIAEVIQLVANAGCCVIYQDRDGILHIEPLEAIDTDYYISEDNAYAFPETVLSKQLKAITVNDEYTLPVSDIGETQPVNNPLISADRAHLVAEWVRDRLTNRQSLDGEWRADPRVDCLDQVKISSQFGAHDAILTSVKFTYNGAFRGTYEGKAIGIGGVSE